MVLFIFNHTLRYRCFPVIFSKFLKTLFFNKRHPENCLQSPGAFGQSCFVEYPFRNKVRIFFCKCSWLKRILIKSQGIPLNVARIPINVTGIGVFLEAFQFLEAVTQRCSVKKAFLKFQKIHRKIPVLETPFKCSCRSWVCNFLKKWLQRGCSLGILRSFKEHLICRKSAYNCFCVRLIFPEQLFWRHLQTSLVKFQAVWCLPSSFL